MKSKKIVIISHAFPPSMAANAKRPYLIARELLANGYEVEVVSSYRELEKGYKEQLDHRNLKITRIHDPIAEIVIKLLRGNKFKIFIANFIKWVVWPDFACIWTFRVIKYLRNIEYDRVILGIRPKSSVFVALFPGICDKRWIIDYQDSLTPFLKEHKSKALINIILFPVLEYLEKKMLKNVGDVFFTSNANLQKYINMGLVEKSKTHLVYLFYDESLYDETLKPDKNYFDIVYAGKFDSQFRSPEAFFKAFKIFIEKTPEAVCKVRINIYGELSPYYLAIAKKLGIIPYLNIHEPVNYTSMLSILMQSSVLLLITANEHNLFIPGKLSDYLGAKRAILSCIPENSEIEQILLETDSASYICKDNSVADGVKALTILWNEFIAGGLDKDFHGGENFAMKYQIEQIMQVLES